MKKLASCLLVLMLLLLLLPASALAAAKKPLLWISPTGERTADAIAWYQGNGSNLYFFLPGNYSTEGMRFGFADAKKIAFSKPARTISAGDDASFLQPGKYSVTVDGKKKTLHVLRGSANLPALYITTASGRLDAIQKSKDVKERGALIFVGPDGQVQYNGELSHIKCRGNSSMTFVKKNYQIKLQTGTSLMSMGKAKKWILTGNYRDKSLLRNQVVYDTAMYLNMPYTPEHIQAEVYINNEYQGLYLFSEKVEIDDDRVDIFNLEKATEEMNDKALDSYGAVGSKGSAKGKYKAFGIPHEPEDISGGYLVEFESYPVRYKQEKSAYTTRKNDILVLKSPEYASVRQMEYVSSRLQAFENAIFSKTGADPESGLHYSQIVEMDSLARKYMIEEFTKNYDGNSSSMYFYKPTDSVSTLFYAGPVWDYDSTFGSYAQEHNAKNVLSGKGLWIAGATDKKLWWPALYKQADFRRKVAQVWQDEFRTAAEILLGKTAAPENSPLKSLDRYAEAIRASYEMNLIRWPRPSNPSSVANTGNTLDANIKHLKTFIGDRYTFLNGEWK